LFFVSHSVHIVVGRAKLDHPEWVFLLGKGYIQTLTYGFTYKTITELNLYREFVGCFGQGHPIPLKLNGSLNLEVLKESIAKVRLEESIRVANAIAAETAREAEVLLHRLHHMQLMYPEIAGELEDMYKQRQVVVGTLREWDGALEAQLDYLEKFHIENVKEK